MEIVGWFTSHLSDIVMVVGAVVALASVITGLTDTPRDDEALAAVKRFLRQVGLLKHANEDGTLKLPGGK